MVFRQSIMLLMGCILFVSCASTGKFAPDQTNYVTLYGPRFIQKDTGWSFSRAEAYQVKLWDVPYGANRNVVAEVPIGSTLPALSSTKEAYQVEDPQTGQIGWVERSFVEKVLTDPADKSVTTQAVRAVEKKDSRAVVTKRKSKSKVKTQKVIIRTMDKRPERKLPKNYEKPVRKQTVRNTDREVKVVSVSTKSASPRKVRSVVVSPVSSS